MVHKKSPARAAAQLQCKTCGYRVRERYILRGYMEAMTVFVACYEALGMHEVCVYIRVLGDDV